MPSTRFAALPSVLLVICLAATGAAQARSGATTLPRTAPENSRERYAVQAARVDQAPRIDGVLDDQVWQSAPVLDQFVQQEPREGEPATERTEVRVMYDSGHLYIGVHAYDSQPSGIVATEMRRDSDRLLDEDSFQVILDTFNDSRNGYLFVTTPLGAKLEEQIAEEGEGNVRGTNSNLNRNWDGVWDAAARVTDDGWTAEIVIPMTTVRFLPGHEQVWGVNFQRNIRRKNEVAFWAPIPKAYSLTRVSMAGRLTGLQSLSRGMDLKLKPFIATGVRKNRMRAGAFSTSVLHDLGADARYGVSAGLNLDLTYNTDFAQVEVDQQQVNLTRFSLFFPEKRDFFLENAGIFAVGTGTTFTSSAMETDLFFSRRIGLSSTGQPIPIVGGARLAGKAGRHNIGLLDIQTDSAFGKPGDNFLVTRYSADVLKRSRVGAIYIGKESTGGSPHYNRTMGVDTNLALGRNLQVNSYLAKTTTPGAAGRDMAFFGRIAYRDPSWNLYLNYLDVQDNFNPEVGFVQRRGVRATKAHFGPTPRPGRAHVRLMEPMFVLTYVTDQSNRLIGRVQHFMVGATLDDGSFLNVVHERNLEVLDEPFQVQPGVTIPVGTYTFGEWNLTFNTNPARRIYERLNYSPNKYYDGTRQSLTATVGLRASSRFAAELQYTRNDVKLRYGNFLANLTILRLDYTFSPRATVRSLTQYNSSTREITNNVRFNLIYRPGSDLYVVYSDLKQTERAADVFAPSDRQIVVKLNYLLAR